VPLESAHPGELDAALTELLGHLGLFGYRFVTPTPESHRRVMARRAGETARDLRDVFGWNLPFSPRLFPAPLFERLADLRILREEEGLYKSEVRVASLGDRLFLHSAFPTVEKHAVFFGPDSYRFARFVEAELADGREVRRLVDIGAGAGVGAIVAGARLPDARLTLTDINPAALRLAAINARHAGLEVELVEGQGIDRVAGSFDLAIANPPFMIDEGGPAYRDGGDLLGARLSREWALAAARRLMPGGRMILYTGSAIVGGRDPLRQALEDALPQLGGVLRYEEIDPDIFGEALDLQPYRGVERIAAIGAVIELRG
jgi:methylase of polypeptide subunit release factors